MSNPSNISANPRFTNLEFAKANSPRGSWLFEKAIWTSGTSATSAPIILQPPQNNSNGEMFFVKEVHLLIKHETSLGNGKFQIFHNNSNPQVIMDVESVIELHNHFDIDPSTPLQNPTVPTDNTEVYNKLLLILPVPMQIRSSTTDRLEIRYTDSVNNKILTGLPNGEMHISLFGWRILEASY